MITVSIDEAREACLAILLDAGRILEETKGKTGIELAVWRHTLLFDDFIKALLVKDSGSKLSIILINTDDTAFLRLSLYPGEIPAMYCQHGKSPITVVAEVKA